MTERQLIMSYIITFLFSLAAIYFMHEIIVRIRNKTQKRTRQQASHMRIDLRKIVANYDKFIETNTKNMYLFEKKEFIKNINSELYSMILKGVR